VGLEMAHELLRVTLRGSHYDGIGRSSTDIGRGLDWGPKRCVPRDSLGSATEQRQKDKAMDYHKEKMESQLKSWNTRFEKLTGPFDQTGSSDITRCRDELKAKQEAVLLKLDEFKKTGNRDRTRFNTDIWVAWNELENSFVEFQRLVRQAEQEDRNSKKDKNNKDSVHPGKRISTSAEEPRFDLEKLLTITDKETDLKHQLIVERAFFLWRRKGFLPELEEICWFQADSEMKQNV